MEALLTLDDKERRKRFFRNLQSSDNLSVKTTTSIPRSIPSALSSYFQVMPSTSTSRRIATSKGSAFNKASGSSSGNSSGKVQKRPTTKYFDHIGFKVTSRKKNAAIRQQDITEHNRYDLCKRRRMKALVNSGLVELREKVPLLEKYELPEETREKYAQFVRPMNDIELKRLMRPKIYYYMEVKDLRPLGRIVIQLFTEACPEVVLEFVRMCMEHNTKMLAFTRLFPLLWIEGELFFKRQTLLEPNFEYDMQVMDHGYGPGILSFSKRFCDTGFRGGAINFSLSFKPLAMANENRVVFGVVTRGLNVLESLPDYGCTSGKLKKEIIVRKCGMFVW